MNKKTNANGITLIALVVTIIVLLILAGVAINLIAGGDGIMAKTQNAVIRHNIEEAKERVILRVSEYHKDYYQATYVDKTSSVNIEMGDWIADAHKGEEIEAGDYIFTITGNSAPYKITILKHNKLPGEVYGKLLLNGKVIWDDIEEGGGNGENPGEDEPESEVINRNITEPGTYEMVIDAGQVVNWDSVVIQYYKYVENSLSLKVYTSDDEINWTEEVASEPTMDKQLAKYDISQATRTQFLKVEVTLSEVSGENSELDYVLVNFYKYREVELEPEITTTAVETNGVYTVPTSSSGQVEAIGLATVTQKVTIPTDGDEYMVDFSESFGTPSTTVKITNPDGTTEDYTDANMKKFSIKPAAQVETTTTLDAGDGIGKLKVFAKESAVSNEEKTSAEQPEEVIEWKTVEQKRFVYNNGGTGYWEKCLVNGTEVDETGILMESENATKRIKVRYQTSSNGESWSGSFTNIEDAANAQLLRVFVEYQVYGNIEYGDTSNDTIKVILNDGSWIATFKDEDGTELFTRRVYFENSNKTVAYALPEYPGEKEGKKFMYWKTGEENCTAGSSYNLTANTEFTAVFGYTVSYDANGGTGSVPASVNYEEGAEVEIDFSTVPTKSGYLFLGWSESKSATEPTYSAIGTKKFTMGTENVELYAVYVFDTQVYHSQHPELHIPTGFAYKTGSVSTGYVIADSAGNEFVWIPVASSSDYVKKAGTNNWVMTTSGGNSTSISTMVKGDVLGVSKILDKTVTSTLNANQPESAIVNAAGGFWVGRYEAGIANEPHDDIAGIAVWTDDQASANASNTYWESKRNNIVVKQDSEPVRSITQEKALSIANEWKSGNAGAGTAAFQSGLITGAQWDAMCNFIGWDTCDSDCTAWGNYTVTAGSSYTGYHSSHNANDWFSEVGVRKNGTGTNKWILPTGRFVTSNDVDTANKNIFDVAGNVWEMTTETPQYSTNNCVTRGGGSSDGDDSIYFASCRYSISKILTCREIGFRIVLYVE